MSGTERLYTPELLALTLTLAEFPFDETLPLEGTARSPTCGSTLAMRIALDERGAVQQVALKVQACAVGQASAAIFADAARGRGAEEISRVAQQMADWLAGKASLPDWPGLATIEAARSYPGRHGAMMLPWQAALMALSTNPPNG